MRCRICGYEVGHSKDCPAYDPREKPAAAKGGTGEVRYSGREFEYDLFGQAKVRDPKYVEALRRVQKDNGYVTYKDSVELVKKFQPWDPTNPDKAFFKDLLLAVQERLDIDPTDEPDAVAAYTALKTPLDERHGVDAFLTLRRDGRESMVTLDATLNKEKQASGHKADLVIGDEFPLVEEDEDGYLKAIDELAARVAERFESQRPAAAE